MSYKTICVWGSPGSCKSTVAEAIAWQLVDKKFNVLIVNTSSEVPMLPLYLPGQKASSANSLGYLLSMPNLEYSALKNKIHMSPHSDKLGYMALVSGETPLTYSPFERIKLLAFLKTLASPSIDYIIIDCCANPMIDTLTLIALERAELVIRAITPDIKGIEFTKSHLSWLGDSIKIDTSRQIKLAGPVKEYSAIDEVGAAIGGFDYILPESREVYSAFVAGGKFGICKDAAGLCFDKEIAKLVAERVMSDA